MKTYIKPITTETRIEMQHLMQNSITSVTGLDGVETSSESFGGGSADSRRGNVWDDED
ncbi:MAG: hypothetical protein II949_10175 [Prevotella sp.]|nr:hypothetical protein [Prevotella sp.]